MAKIEDKRKMANNPEATTRAYLDAIKNGRTYEPNPKDAIEYFNQERPKREIKGPNKDKKKYTGKEVRKKIGAIALSFLILAGAGTGIAKGIENSQETTRIIEQYDGDVNKIKSAIEEDIVDEFEKTLGEENLSVEISKLSNGSGNRIKVKDEKDNVLVNVFRKHDLDGGLDYGDNKSEKLGSIADEYLSLKEDNPHKAAKLLKKVRKFFGKRDLSVTLEGNNTKVDDIKDDGFEIGD